MKLFKSACALVIGILCLCAHAEGSDFKESDIDWLKITGHIASQTFGGADEKVDCVVNRRELVQRQLSFLDQVEYERDDPPTTGWAVGTTLRCHVEMYSGNDLVARVEYLGVGSCWLDIRGPVGKIEKGIYFGKLKFGQYKELHAWVLEGVAARGNSKDAPHGKPRRAPEFETQRRER